MKCKNKHWWVMIYWKIPFFVVVSPCFSNIHRGTQVVLISTTQSRSSFLFTTYRQIEQMEIAIWWTTYRFTNFTKSLTSSQFLILWNSLSLGTFWPLYPESNGLGYARGFQNLLRSTKCFISLQFSSWPSNPDHAANNDMPLVPLLHKGRGYASLSYVC